MIEPAVVTSEPTSSVNLSSSRAKPPETENPASPLTASAAAHGADTFRPIRIAANASAGSRPSRRSPSTQPRARARALDQHEAAAIRGIPDHLPVQRSNRRRQAPSPVTFANLDFAI